MAGSPAWDPNAKYTVSVDFDGVCHSYTTKWIDAATIPDPPVDGAIDWLNEIAETFKVVIHTTRAKDPAGVQAIINWFREYGFDASRVEITCVKPAALVYVDDRAYRFDGKNFPTPHMISKVLIPWNKRPMGLT